jgi:Ca2+-binding RTX toxin-like protein
VAIITGTSGNNNLTGTSGNDEITGLGGNDVIDGGLGDDFLDGGAGDDTVRGGGGADSIDDFEGSGSIDGGDGADTLWIYRDGPTTTLTANGGNDNDRFYINIDDSSHLTANGGAGSDTVSIGSMRGTLQLTLGGSRDIINFYGGLFRFEGETNFRWSGITVSDFTAGATGDVIDWDGFLADSLIGWNQSANPFGAGYLRLVKSGNNTLVQLDADGGGTAHAFGTLLILANKAPTSFVSANFDGYDPTGAATKGITVHGTDAWDMLTGTVGDDVMYANGGGGQLSGSGGADKLYGGAEQDNLMGEVGHDLLDGGGGDDSLWGGHGNDKMLGGAGNDYFYGEQGNDVIEGGDGDDYLSGGSGSDRLIGGEGNDQLVKTDGGSVTMDGGNGDDVFEVYSNAFGTISLLGGAGNDRFSIYNYTPDTFSLDAGAGSDRIEFAASGGGAKSVKTGSGVDTLAFTGRLYDLWVSGIVVQDFQAGPGGDRIDWVDLLKNDLIAWDGRANPFLAGYLRIVQSGTSALLQVDPDADDFNFGFITLAEFANSHAPGLSTENLGGYSPIPVRNGDSGSNTIKGTGGAERINGLAGSDRLLGYAGDDLLVGDSGNDYLDGGSGADTMFGGTGDDTFIVNSASDRVFELAGQGIDRVESTASFTLSGNIETLILKGTASISGTGDASNNHIVGNSGVNRLYGNGGNDLLDGGAGADTMRGGLGDDRFIVDSTGDVVIEDNRAGTDTIEARVNYKLPVQVERLVLAGSSPLEGRGNTSDNWLYGNSGDNLLNGGRGNDRIEGGAGHDWIYGSYGNDVLVGGSGKDRFYFHTEPAAGNVDRILDFSPRDDTIYLARYAFDGLTGNGTLSSSAFRAGTRAGDSNDRVIYDKATGNIFYDEDGSGASAQLLVATVTPATALTYADFSVYG